MKKIISLLLTITAVILLLCSCNNTQVKEPIIEQTEESVDEVALGVETYLADSTHDKGRYAMFQVEGKIVSDNESAIRTWLVCYLDKDSDINWYIVTWDGERYEKYAFQP